jgi:ubiquinone/menaquinone biosynthesis C-methylase UbiE
MDGWVARWYARTRRNDMDDFRREAKAAAEHLRSGCEVLEVAAGPGFFAIELAKLGNFHITGLDISRTLVEIATKNARNAGAEVDFRWGNAAAMPFPDDSFDFLYCSAAFKNFSEPVKALDEMHRVLRALGEALVTDLRKDVAVEEIDAYVKQSGRNPVDALITRWTFRHMLVQRAYTKDDFLCMAAQSRFGTCQVDVGPIRLEVHFRKEAIQRLASGIPQ